MKEAKDRSGELSRREFLPLVGMGMAGATIAGFPELGYSQEKRPKRGGRLRIASRYGATGLDAHRNQDWQERQIHTLMYGALIDLGQSPDVETFPMLAKSWEISHDAREFIFSLREGVKFHHGKELDSADAKYSIERVMNPATRSPRAFAFRWIDSVSVIDKYHVKIKLKEPFAPILSTLTLVVCPVLPAGWEPTPTKPAPGTGPFVFKSFVPNETVELTRFNQYWEVDEKTGDRLPYVDHLYVKKIVDETVRLTALRAGDVDFVEVPPLNVLAKAVLEKPIPGIVMYNHYAGNPWIYFNVTKPPYDNKKVRQAFAYAIDKKEIAQGTSWDLGQTVNHQPFADYSRFYIPVKDRERNIAKAKQLLSEAGYPNGFETEFTNQTGESVRTGCTIFMAQLGQIGVKGTMKILDPAAWLTTMRKGDYQISYSGDSDKYDFDDAYYMHLHSEEIGKNNFSKYSNKEVDDLLQKGRTTWKWEERIPIYRRVIEIVREDLPHLYVGKTTNGVGLRDYLRGYQKGSLRYGWYGGGVKYWWLDK